MTTRFVLSLLVLVLPLKGLKAMVQAVSPTPRTLLLKPDKLDELGLALHDEITGRRAS